MAILVNTTGQTDKTVVFMCVGLLNELLVCREV